MPPPSDLTRLALRTLEDALAQAEHGRVPHLWAYRLALTCLLNAGIAEPWQCRKFWKAMNDPYAGTYNAQYAKMMRIDAMIGSLNNWHFEAGLKPPSHEERGQRVHALTSPIDSVDTEEELERMCNRYQPGERKAITSLFGARELRQFNAGPDTVHPKDPGWVVRMHEGELVLDQMTWGFPVVLKGKAGQPLKPKPVNNARFDKMGAFWRRWASVPAQRCLIPATRFAEAVGEKGRMTETWLSVKDQPIFAWAGLWRTSDEWGDCYTGVMTSACSELLHIHDRSPVIIEPHEWGKWLNYDLLSLKQFDKPLPALRMAVEATGELWVKR
jgi:putative SOS response-associated peptidase YedK